MDKYACMTCNASGTRDEIPYRIIDIKNYKTKFKGQLCEKCFNELILSKKNNKTKGGE